MLQKKVLIAVSSRNTHFFLDHFVKTFERHDPGYACDLLVVDEGSTNQKQLKLLEQLSKKYMVRVRESTGRAQGTYEYVRANFRNQYEYYFLLHNDSSILRNNWLRFAIKSMHDDRVEPGIEDELDIRKLPVGKVGFQGYMHSTLTGYYLEPLKKNGLKIISAYPYADKLLDFMGLEHPKIYQLINDDRHLWTNDLFSKIDVFWSIEEFRKRRDTEMFKKINDFYNDPKNPFTKIQHIQPIEIYNDANWEGFQGVSELMTTLAPYRFGFRTHCILDNGTLQEQVGWTRFWGCEIILHFGSHNFYKRMSLLHRIDEDEFRKKLNNEPILTACDKIVKAETNWVEEFLHE